MRGASLVVSLAFVVSCSNNKSRLDPARGTGDDVASDPWSQLKSQKGSGSGDDDTFGGLDLRGILQKVTETLEKPGPYEAPEQSTDFDQAKPHWGVLDVGGAVIELEAFSFSSGRGAELRKLIDRLRVFANDDTLIGLVLRVSPIDISLPDAVELRAVMHELRAAGKQLRCHTEDATNATYLVLAACEEIGLAPLGQIAIPGPAALPIHIKPLLEKLGVQADFLHVGAYKGAAEPLTRDAPSPEMAETLGAILDRRYATMIDVIAKDRRLEPAKVKTLIDTALFTPEQAQAVALVDVVASFEMFRDSQQQPWTKLEIIERASKDQMSMLLKAMRFFGAAPPERPLADHVAIVYALGNIVDGDDGGLLGARGHIASHTMVAALRAIERDDAVKAVVLRIDSGGGSAQASELIWRAVADLKTKKPVVVSMSDVAASGGYYIAAGATKIFALEDTLTGSIGVVGGKIAPSGALAKIGVNTFPMGRGKRATMMASLSPWNDDEKAVIQRSMEDVYKTFLARVAAGRKMTAEQVQPIAQGRVWTGAKAKQLGLVDELGGLDAALAEARKLGKIGPVPDVQVYPPAPTLRDFLKDFGDVSTPLGLGVVARDAIAAIATLDPQLAAAAERMVRLVMSFQTTHVQAVTLVPVVQ